MKSTSKNAIAAAALSVLTPLGCAVSDQKPAASSPQAEAGTAASATAAHPPAGMTGVSGIRQPKPGLYTAGQPAADQWRGIAETGVTTVINLRPDAELEGRDVRAEVDAAGMRYIQLPVAGAQDITGANADALAQALKEADGPVLVHCASGNRVGALLALGAARSGTPVEEAIAFGKSAGLGSAETVVRQRLDETAGD